MVALGVDADGHKHPLGLWEGGTENKAVCRSLLSNLVERGLDPERPRLCVLDGGKAIRSALQTSFGKDALVSRCQLHKRRNVLEHLHNSQRGFIGGKFDRIYKELDADRATAELRTLAYHLETRHPGAAAASLREGLHEMLTVSRHGLTPSLHRTLRSTNPIESMISATSTERHLRRALDSTLTVPKTKAS